MEYIFAGKPLVAFPHFGDQPDNANTLISKGAAIMLPTSKPNSTMLTMAATKPCFNAADVTKAFKKAAESDEMR